MIRLASEPPRPHDSAPFTRLVECLKPGPGAASPEGPRRRMRTSRAWPFRSLVGQRPLPGSIREGAAPSAFLI
jgi:hypothetical protein